MMVCSRAMINVARKMEERYGIPYFEGSFYGIGDCSDSLRTIARLLVQQGAPESLITRTETLIAIEEARAWARLEPYRERLSGKKVLLITGGVKSWSMVAALQALGMEVIGTSVKKSTKEDKARIVEIMGDDAHMIENMRQPEMFKVLKETGADIMLSGSRSQFAALKAKMPWLDVNQDNAIVVTPVTTAWSNWCRTWTENCIVLYGSRSVLLPPGNKPGLINPSLWRTWIWRLSSNHPKPLQ